MREFANPKIWSPCQSVILTKDPHPRIADYNIMEQNNSSRGLVNAFCETRQKLNMFSKVH